MLENNERKGDWMQTYTGQKFWPIDPKPEEIKIDDIAHALSMMCRYNGHCKNFYSVAEHSVLISENVPQEHALWGLLHDASEAYIADIIRPVKPYIQGYRETENTLLKTIAKRFGLSEKIPKEVKDADNAILIDEMEQVMGEPPESWYGLPNNKLNVEIKNYLPEEAKQIFKNRFKEIYRENN